MLIFTKSNRRRNRFNHINKPDSVFYLRKQSGLGQNIERKRLCLVPESKLSVPELEKGLIESKLGIDGGKYRLDGWFAKPLNPVNLIGAVRRAVALH